MTDQKAHVDYMCKVGVQLEACTQEKEVIPQAAPFSFEFIFGIGSQGISPFEKQIFGKRVGDELAILLAPQHGDHIFDHLTCNLKERPDLLGHPYLKISVQSIHKANSREVIKAMAEAAGGCGEGCDCGCGGTH